MSDPLRAEFQDYLRLTEGIWLQAMLEENYDKGHAVHRVAYEALQDSIRRDECEDFDVDKAQEELRRKVSKILQGLRFRSDTSSHLSSTPSGASGFCTPKPDLLKPPLRTPPSFYHFIQGRPAYEIVKAFHPDVVHLQFQMEECHKLLTDKVDDAILQYNVSKPLPLGGEPGHITIQSDFFFNKDLEYLRYGRKIGRPALSISKIKGGLSIRWRLEQLVPDQFWIEEECKYDIAAMYGISHWWFQRQRFYIDRFSSEGDRRAVRTHMRILSVVRIEVFSMYGYNYMKKIILRRADLKEYVIAERDFKYMYPSDFEDSLLVNLSRGATWYDDGLSVGNTANDPGNQLIRVIRMVEDIQCAGSNTRPPMLDKTDFASWQQRIRLYCRGKENGVNILKSIDEGPFQMGTTRVIVAEGTEGSLNLGPERP
ncbi:hypothetical protein Tco_0831380 [Tanacetum coccineum]